MPSLLSNRCPQCHQGEIFRGFVLMNAQCGQCGHRFEKEFGYFLGAMIVSYLLGCLSIVPTLVWLVFVVQSGPLGVILIPSLQVIIMIPLLFRFSRLIWIHFDAQATKKIDA
ncbi:MAG: DUF983 domain-containing protein [Bacteriovoracia bacterium]